uniref:Transmembrane protein n=1 Tax=Ascaris lumbricoides TaxID=6252 RepID=A0A0M3IB40_ASCLU
MLPNTFLCSSEQRNVLHLSKLDGSQKILPWQRKAVRNAYLCLPASSQHMWDLLAFMSILLDAWMTLWYSLVSHRKWRSALCSMATPFLASAFCLRIGPETEREHVMCADVKRPSRQAVELRRVRSCSGVVNAIVQYAAACHQRLFLRSAVARVLLHVVSICCGRFASIIGIYPTRCCREMLPQFSKAGCERYFRGVQVGHSVFRFCHKVWQPKLRRPMHTGVIYIATVVGCRREALELALLNRSAVSFVDLLTVAVVFWRLSNSWYSVIELPEGFEIPCSDVTFSVADTVIAFTSL